MAAPTPTLDVVLSAIESQINTLAPLIGSVFKQEHNLEDDMEFLRANVQELVTAEADAWFMELEGAFETDGPSVGETYVNFLILIRHINVRADETDWVDIARDKGQQVADVLSGNPSVFRIAGQPQLRTPETVEVGRYGKETIEGPVHGVQTAVLGSLRLSVEARRWV